MYHCELFISKNGNVSYTKRILGSKILLLDRCIFGWLITTVILGVLIGPFYFFSDYGGFISPNPVKESQIDVAFIVNKTITKNDFNTS